MENRNVINQEICSTEWLVEFLMEQIESSRVDPSTLTVFFNSSMGVKTSFHLLLVLLVVGLKLI